MQFCFISHLFLNKQKKITKHICVFKLENIFRLLSGTDFVYYV